MIELDDLLQATGGQVYGRVAARHFVELAFDSRRISRPSQVEPSRSGPLFVAVKSDTGDGHDFIVDAASRGATGVLCQRIPAGLPDGLTCIVVQDTRQALLDWARYILQKHGTEVIAVTGSSGKTMAKEAIAAVLSSCFAVFRNFASYSGRYGLPIALGQLAPTHRLAVLELAGDSLGEVDDLARLTNPTVGVLTTINQAHIDNMGSIEAIQREKGRLLERLPAHGLAVLNRDNRWTWDLRTQTLAPTVSFGFDPDADCRACNVRFTERGVNFELLLPPASSAERDERGQPVALQLLGRHHVYVALAAAAVGQAYGVSVEEIIAALNALTPLPGRLRPIEGQNGALLLDDSYDAGPACTLAALDALVAHFPDRQRIVVLGDVRWVGDTERTGRQIGERLVEVADKLVVKGERAQSIGRAALAAGMSESRVFATYTNEEAVRHLGRELTSRDVVLIKGARAARMEEVAYGLMMQPAHAPDLLVRQEDAFRHAHLALPERPTWLEVDLEAIVLNLRQAIQIVGDAVQVMVVLKADGYGHGAVRIARTALNNGAHMLAVACLSEGVRLRREGINGPILVLGYTPAWQAREAVLDDITATVFDLDTARAFSRAAGAVGRSARVHVKVDTGMGRLGLLPDQVLPFMRQAIGLPGLVVEGMFTHFSVADEADKTYTYQQLARFDSVLSQLKEAGLHVPIIHAANSAAALTIPRSRFDMVRLGIALYGLSPSNDTSLPAGFRPALSFKTRVAQVKLLPPGSCVSYGNTYQTQDEERIAIIPVGYADGFRRAPAHWGSVLVRGQRAPIVGRVCMDQTMINVTRIPGVRQGDEVVLIGRQGDQAITVEEVAAQLGTINYEVISEILARVPRVS
jgi:alanine racemase